jgi:hypothetical protein
MTDTGISSGLPVGERNPVWHILHTPAQGARASLRAVTAELPSGTYLAPRFNQWGKPRETGVSKNARDPVAARRLWELSAELTGCDWPLPRNNVRSARDERAPNARKTRSVEVQTRTLAENG